MEFKTSGSVPVPRGALLNWIQDELFHNNPKRIFCVFANTHGGTILEDWSRFVLITGGTKKGHFWMQRIAETVGEFLKGDWGRSRLITGGNIGGHYCTSMILLPVSWTWRLYRFNEKSTPDATCLKTKAKFMGMECLFAPNHLFKFS